MWIVTTSFLFAEGSYAEIIAWQKGTQTALTGWEFQTIYLAVNARKNMSVKGQDKDCPPPYKNFFSDEILIQMAQREDQRFKDTF